MAKEGEDVTMAKLKNPLVSLSATGRLTKALSLSRRKRLNIITTTPLPKDVRSLAQLSWRHMYQKAIALWNALSQAEKDEWESLARSRHMPGIAYFLSQALKPNPGLYLPLQGGTMAGDIDMDGHLILNCPSIGAVPSGLIVMWHGLIANIPTGWLLCNGTLGTPDLRDKFVKGAPPGIDPGGTGGSNTHTHDDHPSQVHAGCAVNDHPSQAHAGCAVASHSSQSHSGTAVADHAAKDTSTFTGNKQLVSAGSGATDTHKHTVSLYTHSVTQPSAHPSLAHSVTQANDHPALAHTVTQPNTHPALSHSTEDNIPEYYEVAFIMKS